MGISGTTHALMFALSGTARAGGARSGYRPVGQVFPLYALSGVARSGATRVGWHSPKMCISLAGVERGYGRTLTDVSVEGLRITDIQGATASCATFLVRGARPVAGAEIVARLGSINNPARIFAGHLLQVTQAGPRGALAYPCSAVDYTWLLGRRRVTARYTATSASTIAVALVSGWSSGFTTSHIQAGLATVDEITFTDVPLDQALTQLAKRIGGDWYCDYHKDVHLFTSDPALITNPTPLTGYHPSLEAMQATWDLSQVVTRVYVEGGGGKALAAVAAGETILPVTEAVWYPALGGTVLCGPQALTYTGRSLGGGGGLVGTGASPSAASVAALTSGAGLESGAHGYATTFVTGAGESLPGPVTSITVGVVAAPTTAPTAAAPTIGTGPNPGSHDYAVTFVTSSGETTAGPSVTKATTLTADPATAPTPALAAGAGIDTGGHDYAVTCVTAIGETLPSPISSQVTCGPVVSGQINAPASAPTAGAPSVGTGPDDGAHVYGVTFVNAAGETTSSATSGSVTTSSVAADPVDAPGDTPSNTRIDGSYSPGWAVGDVISYKVTFCNAYGETTASPESDGVAGTAYNETYMNANAVSLPVSAHGSVTARRLYRYRNGSIVGYDQINDNSATSRVDFNGVMVPGVSPPGSNTAIIPAVYTRAVGVSGILTGPSGTTKRRVYRTAAGGAQLKLLVEIANNSTTTYNDQTADADLGADAPTSNTTGTTTNYNQVHLSAIPKGDANVTSRTLYRRSGGAGLRLLATIADNTTTTYADTIANSALGAAAPVSSTAYVQRLALSAIPLGGALVTARNVYRTEAGGAQLKLLATIADNTTTTFADTVTDASLGAHVPTSNTATAHRVALSSIPVGPAGTTSRHVYRTEAAGSTLKLLVAIADNTTTTYADSTADASLTTTAPSTDASGLTQPAGQVLAGATSMPVAGTGAFPAVGWAVIGNGQQVIRYGGKTVSSLTGIPASGIGSVAASIAYNSSVTAAPQLTGIPASGAGAILWAIAKGDAVNLRVTVNDTAAQAALAALIGGDGVQESSLQDRRLSATEATARGLAQLALANDVAVSLTYRVRDQNTKAGRDVVVDLLSPVSLSGTFRIQQVGISDFTPNIYPDYDVQASSMRYTFEDLLRRLSEETR
jgi:hypothetical protein